jgi:hypothetical protein
MFRGPSIGAAVSDFGQSVQWRQGDEGGGSKFIADVGVGVGVVLYTPVVPWEYWIMRLEDEK